MTMLNTEVTPDYQRTGPLPMRAWRRGRNPLAAVSVPIVGATRRYVPVRRANIPERQATCGGGQKPRCPSAPAGLPL